MTTILLVDDEPAILRALRRQFTRAAEVLTASGAAEALAILEAGDIAMMLTDYRMPSRNGVDLLREVRQRWPRTRRFLMSGNQVAGIEKMIASGLVETFFPKPLDFAAILAVLMGAG